jgi:plasmid stabilization system protein ParE
MNFVVQIEPEAIQDIQDAIDWYEHQQKGLGEKFYHYLDNVLESLGTNPYYQVRYSNIRCLPLQKYPFMIHFTIDEANAFVIIRAIFNTSIDPIKWKSRD